MMDPKTKLCFGCGRTLPEIARWHRMETAERWAVMEGLAARMAPQIEATYRGIETVIGAEFSARFYRALDELIGALQ